MIPSDPPRERRSTLVLARELEVLLGDRGSLRASEACRFLLRAGSVPDLLAKSILARMIEGDRRFAIAPDGSVRLAPPPARLPTPLSRTCFTVIDLETTGGSPRTDRILEVGAVRIERGRIRESFETLVNPGVPIPAFISAVTGIRPEMAAKAPPFARVAEGFSRFLGESVLVAHNLPFDLGFLNAELSRACGFVVSNAALCTVRLGRRLLPHLPDRRLDTLAEHYGFSFTARHRAVGDAEVTARVLLKLLATLREMGIRDLEGVGRFLAGNAPGLRGPRRVSGRERRPVRPARPPSSAGS